MVKRYETFYAALIRRMVVSIVIATFSASLIVWPSGLASAQTFLNLPPVGNVVLPSPGFVPTMLKGIKLYPENPLRFDFIVDTGYAQMDQNQLRLESDKLIKYFLASLTVPAEEMWVNLSPSEPDRIVAQSFGLTEMGRDLLAQDYLLKQLTASLMDPQKNLGQKFWDKIYAQTGNRDVPLDMLNKVWIVPDTANVFQSGSMAFVSESRLKVMMEEDYLVKNLDIVGTADLRSVLRLSKKKINIDQQPFNEQQIIREIFIPAIEQEINEGENFAVLRQIYHSMILATWFKRNLQKNILGQIYVDENKVSGIDIEDKQSKQKIYEQYLKAFEAGVYNYIKEDYDPAAQRIITHQYFSGGLEFGEMDYAMNVQQIEPLEFITQTTVERDGDYATLAVELDPVFSEGSDKLQGVEIELFDEDAAMSAKSMSKHVLLTDSDRWILKAVEELRGEKGEITEAMLAKKAGVHVTTLERRKKVNEDVRRAVNGIRRLKSDALILDAIEQLRRENLEPTNVAIMKITDLDEKTIINRKKASQEVRDALNRARLPSFSENIIQAVNVLLRRGRAISNTNIANQARLPNRHSVLRHKAKNPLVRDYIRRAKEFQQQLRKGRDQSKPDSDEAMISLPQVGDWFVIKDDFLRQGRVANFTNDPNAVERRLENYINVISTARDSAMISEGKEDIYIGQSGVLKETIDQLVNQLQSRGISPESLATTLNPIGNSREILRSKLLALKSVLKRGYAEPKDLEGGAAYRVRSSDGSVRHGSRGMDWIDGIINHYLDADGYDKRVQVHMHQIHYFPDEPYQTKIKKGIKRARIFLGKEFIDNFIKNRNDQGQLKGLEAVGKIDKVVIVFDVQGVTEVKDFIQNEALKYAGKVEFLFMNSGDEEDALLSLPEGDRNKTLSELLAELNENEHLLAISERLMSTELTGIRTELEGINQFIDFMVVYLQRHNITDPDEVNRRIQKSILGTGVRLRDRRGEDENESFMTELDMVIEFEDLDSELDRNGEHKKYILIFEARSIRGIQDAKRIIKDRIKPKLKKLKDLAEKINKALSEKFKRNIRANGSVLFLDMGGQQTSSDERLNESRQRGKDEIVSHENRLTELYGVPNKFVFSDASHTQTYSFVHNYEEILRWIRSLGMTPSQVKESGDSAMTAAVSELKQVKRKVPDQSASEVGGIDFNSDQINIQTQGEMTDFTLPPELQYLRTTPINGFVPIILEILPTNFPLLLGLGSEAIPKPIASQRLFQELSYFKED